MSETALKSLRDYLLFVLSPSDRQWLAHQLTGQERRGESRLKPYTMEEINQMIAEGERQFAEGEWIDSEEMFRKLEDELAKEEQCLELAEAV